MLKTITKTKQMRLDELIKYGFENNIKNKVYRSDNGKSVRFDSGWDIGSEDLFTVEVEEEITEDTEFEQGVVVLKYGAIHVFFKSNIKYLKQRYAGQQFKIYVFIDGGLELICGEDNNGEK